MPKAIPNPESQWSRSTREPARHGANGERRMPYDQGTTGKAMPAILEPVVPADGFGQDGSPLLADNELAAQLLNADGPAAIDPDADLARLRAENVQLRQLVAELQHTGGDAVRKREQVWNQRQKEYETLLEEKSEIIRQLHLKIQELQEKPAAPAVPQESELLAMSDELERERCQLQQERRQLEKDLKQFKDDEAGMMEQMRQMEVQMARERAELARQRSEIQRLQDEIRFELERSERNQDLNDRLGQLRQRYQDVVARGGPGPSRSAGSAGSTGQQNPPPAKSKDSGILRRLFG